MSELEYYVLADLETKQVIGPFTLRELLKDADAGQLKPSSYVAVGGGEKWATIASQPELCEVLFPEGGEDAFGDVGREVEDLLQYNLSLEDTDDFEAQFAQKLKEKPRISARFRDYLWVNVAGIGAATFFTLLLGLNGFNLVFLLSFVLLFAGGTSWVFFVVMNDY